MSAPASGRTALLCLAALASGACAVGPDYHRPAPPAVSRYTPAGDPAATAPADGAVQRFRPGAAVPPQWWQLFGSAQLDAVIAESIAHNPGLEAARASLAASQDSLRSGYGVFLPSVAVAADAERQKFSSLQLGGAFPSHIFNLFTLSASVSYALDVFGGQRRLIESLHAQADLADAERLGTYLALTSNIANAVIARAGYAAEAGATRALIGSLRDQVRLTEVRAAAGAVPYASVLSLRSQQATYEATLPVLEQKIAQSDDLLAALAGRAPADWRAPPVQLSDLKLPADLPVSLPADLVKQRPDVLMAEATLHSASAQVGVATAAMLPSVTLTGNASLNASQLSNLFPANGHGWLAGADVSMPLFEGGTLWYRRRAAVNGYRQAGALYRQAVLGALQQVADTLQALDHDAQLLDAQERALADAREALALMQANYSAGLISFADLLNTDIQVHQAEIARIEAVTLRYQDTVALFAALGGGWSQRGVDPARTAR